MEHSCCDVALDPANPFQAALLLTTGLTTSFGHCIGMCGPLQTAIASRGPSGFAARLASQGLYHLGRITTYAFLGAVLGFAAPALRALGDPVRVQGTISVVVGLAMLIFSVVLPWNGTSAPKLMPRQWANVGTSLLQRLLGSSRRASRFVLGVANGLLPCGPVAVIAFAATSTLGPVQGGASLAIFGLGTVPVLGALGLGAASLRPQTRGALSKIGAIFLAGLSLQLVLRGLAAWGLVRHAEWRGVVFW